MSKTEFDKLMDHEYDGIREYDNPLPGWWTGIFIATILFSVVYWAFFHLGGPGLSETESYEAEMKAFAAVQAKQAAETGPDEATLAQMQANPAALADAKALFAKHCLACHGANGEGKIGPNMTDSHQIHGSTRVDIYHTIKNGVPAKGMISWEKVLKPAEMMNLTVFVASLRGTNAAGGKAPEGQKVGAFK